MDRVFRPLGASNHTSGVRENNDFYATEPKAVELLLEKEHFNRHIWEPACGQGHISEVLNRHGYDVLSTDLIDRGYGRSGVDFLQTTDIFEGDIITNPPYKYALEFACKGLALLPEGHKMAFLLRIQFLEGKTRRKFFEQYPPRTVYVASSRLVCAKNGDFKTIKSSALCYAWFVWQKGFSGKPTIDWIN